MTYEFSFIITSLDLQTLDLEDYKHADINMTAFRLVDPEKHEVQNIVRQWNSLSSSTTYNSRTPVYGPYYYNAGDQSRGGNRRTMSCLLYTSDAADDLTRVDLGGRRIIKK